MYQLFTLFGRALYFILQRNTFGSIRSYCLMSALERIVIVTEYCDCSKDQSFDILFSFVYCTLWIIVLKVLYDCQFTQVLCLSICL